MPLLTLAECLKYQNAPPSVAGFKHKLLEGSVALAQKYGLDYSVGGEVQRLPVMPAVPTPVGIIPSEEQTKKKQMIDFVR